MDTAFHIKPFAFDRIFPFASAGSASVAAEDLQLQIASLQAELDDMRQSHEAIVALGRAEAFEAGLASARLDRDTGLLAAVDAVHASIEMVDGKMEDITHRITAEAADIALAAAEVLAARAIEDAPCDAIDAAIGRVLKQVARGQDLQIRVHPDLVEGMERLILARQSGERRQLNLHVAADQTLALGDARIEWDQGALELDSTVRRAKVGEQLQGLLRQN